MLRTVLASETIMGVEQVCLTGFVRDCMDLPFSEVPHRLKID